METNAGGDELGDCLETFQSSRANIVAGFILSVLTLAGGIAAIWLPLRGAMELHWQLPFNAERGWCWWAVGLAWLLGVVLIGAAAALAVLSRGLIGRRVEFCRDGFRHHSRQSTDTVRWSDVKLIQEQIVYERAPILKGPAQLLVPKKASTSFKIVTASGNAYQFDGNSVRKIRAFGTRLRDTAIRLSLPYEIVEEHA